MRLPKRGETGFTLIELLIVVAILGVLAAIVIPNVTRFLGAGEEEAAETELSNIQTAVVAMMVDNEIARLDTPQDVATDNMSLFPDSTGNYVLYGFTDNETGQVINYVTFPTSMCKYTVDNLGTVAQIKE